LVCLRLTVENRTWREVVRRAQQIGAPWDTVAVAMTVPVLRRMLARLARPAHLERAEVEQEALAAVAIALRTVDLNSADVGRELFSAAGRAVNRLAYAACRQARRETREAAVHLGRPGSSAALAGGQQSDDVGDDRSEYAVLAQAVQARVVGVTDARLIARTRLEGEPMRRLADEQGVNVRQLYRHRAAAEQHLAAYLKNQLLDQ
jgi:hypothetical protein